MRLFVAIELDHSVRKAIENGQTALKSRCRDVRWVHPSLMHVTVRFLGDVPADRVTTVSDAVAAAAGRSEPFGLIVGRCGCFPPRGAVRTVWVGARDETGAMLRCAEAVNGELQKVGFEPERRPFSAHITLGRVRDDRSRGALREAIEAQAIDELDQPVEAITLMSSVLSPKGPTYSAVSRAKLGA